MKQRFLLLWLVVVVVGAGCQRRCSQPGPLVGITSVYKVHPETHSASTTVNFAYVRAVAENGGVPVVLPTVVDEAAVRRYVAELDGLVLIGGADVPPSAYGQKPHESVEIMPGQRYDFERRLISEYLASGKPILGICLGMQFTNVVLGGTLIQDIPSQVGTKVAHRRKYHRVRIEPNSSLAKILGTHEAHVYSNHHQAVKDLGNSLRIVALSDDGIVEALERVDAEFGLFVQWHPERMSDTEHRDAIYGALVQAAAKHK
jgi:putative glutamine amidotransferase